MDLSRGLERELSRPSLPRTNMEEAMRSNETVSEVESRRPRRCRKSLLFALVTGRILSSSSSLVGLSTVCTGTPLSRSRGDGIRSVVSCVGCFASAAHVMV